MLQAILLFLLAFPLFASEFSYAYIRPEGNATISRGDLRDVLRMRDRYRGETILWARVDGREYVIRDATVLSEVRRAFGPLEALDPHQEALDAKMTPLESRVERLEREGDALSDAEEELSPDEEARLREIEKALRGLQRELRVFEEEERRLDRKEEALEKVFDAEIERIVRRSVRNGTAKTLR